MVHSKQFVLLCHVTRARPSQDTRSHGGASSIPTSSFGFRRWLARRVVDPFHRSWQRFLNHRRRGATFPSAPAEKLLLRRGTQWRQQRRKFVSRASYGTKCTSETCLWAEMHQAMDTQHAAHTQSYSGILTQTFSVPRPTTWIRRDAGGKKK